MLSLLSWSAMRTVIPLECWCFLPIAIVSRRLSGDHLKFHSGGRSTLVHLQSYRWYSSVLWETKQSKIKPRPRNRAASTGRPWCDEDLPSNLRAGSVSHPSLPLWMCVCFSSRQLCGLLTSPRPLPQSQPFPPRSHWARASDQFRCTNCSRDNGRNFKGQATTEITWVTRTKPPITKLAWHKFKAFNFTQQTLNSPFLALPASLPQLPTLVLCIHYPVFILTEVFGSSPKVYFCFLE